MHKGPMNCVMRGIREGKKVAQRTVQVPSAYFLLLIPYHKILVPSASLLSEFSALHMATTFTEYINETKITRPAADTTALTPNLSCKSQCRLVAIDPCLLENFSHLISVNTYTMGKILHPATVHVHFPHEAGLRYTTNSQPLPFLCYCTTGSYSPRLSHDSIQVMNGRRPCILHSTTPAFTPPKACGCERPRVTVPPRLALPGPRRG